MPRTTQSRKLKPTIQVSCEPKSGLVQKPYIGDAHIFRTIFLKSLISRVFLLIFKFMTISGKFIVNILIITKIVMN